MVAAIKRYIGDSVYVTWENGGVWLTTENGLPGDPSNRIYMEGSVLTGFLEFLEYVADMRKAEEAERAGAEESQGG